MLAKYWKRGLLLLVLGLILLFTFASLYLWNYGASPNNFFFSNWRRLMVIYGNRFLPRYFPPPSIETKIKDYVPKEEIPTTLKVLRGVIKEEKDLNNLIYTVDASGTIFYLQFDETKLRSEEQHVLIPHLNAFRSIVIPEGKPSNLLCAGDQIEARIKEDQSVTGKNWNSPFSPENVIVAKEGRSCLPRQVDPRNPIQ